MTTPAFVLTEKCADTSTSTGTGPFVVSGTGPTGFKSPSSVMNSGDYTYLRIDDGTNWEVVFAQYTGSNSFDVYGIMSTSAGNRTPINFGAGSKVVEMVACGGIATTAQFYEKYGDASDGDFTLGASGTSTINSSLVTSGGFPCWKIVKWPSSSTANIQSNAYHVKCWVLDTRNCPSFGLEPTPTNAQSATSTAAPASNGGMTAQTVGVGDASIAGASGGTTGNGSNGGNGSFTVAGNGGASGAGGKGGNNGAGTKTGGNGGGGGTPTPYPGKVPDQWNLAIASGVFGLMQGGAAGAAGGGGGGNGTTGGGGGGGGGAGGNVADISAACILRDPTTTGTAAIACRGGNGGNGFSITTATAGGGGGGAGGGGGWCKLSFSALGNAPNASTNTAKTGFISCAGGAGGNGGSGNTTGHGGDGGAGGKGGRVTLWDYGAQSGPAKIEIQGSNPTTAPTSGAVTAGGSGGNAGVCSVDL